MFNTVIICHFWRQKNHHGIFDKIFVYPHNKTKVDKISFKVSPLGKISQNAPYFGDFER